MKLSNYSNNPYSLLAIITTVLLGGLSHVHAQSLAITGTISNTVGSTGVITGSGTPANTNSWSLGTVGVFEINDGDYFMQVNATNPTGGLNPANDSLMVIQTENSQGLTDSGTLSVYVSPTPSGNTQWSMDLNFSFFSDSALTNAASIDNMMLTSLDIDYDQLYYTSNSTFSTSQTYNTIDGPSAITTANNPPIGYIGYTAAGDSVFNNPRFAVSSTGTGSSFDIQVAHDSVALFMFEFRNPSFIIPEPSSSLLLLGSLTLLGMIRRRRPAA